MSAPMNVALVRREAAIPASDIAAAGFAATGAGADCPFGRLASGTTIGSSIATIFSRSCSNQGGRSRLMPNWSHGSSRANPPSAVAAHSVRMPAGERT